MVLIHSWCCGIGILLRRQLDELTAQMIEIRQQSVEHCDDVTLLLCRPVRSAIVPQLYNRGCDCRTSPQCTAQTSRSAFPLSHLCP